MDQLDFRFDFGFGLLELYSVVVCLLVRVTGKKRMDMYMYVRVQCVWTRALLQTHCVYLLWDLW